MIIDLSHTIKSGMPFYPGSPEPRFDDLGLYDQHGVYVQEFTINGHTGTHIDVPAHLFRDGSSTSSHEISAFIGKGQVIDCSKWDSNGTIGLEVLNDVKVNDLPDFILLYTGWDRMWGSNRYFDSFPLASEDLIRAFAELKIKGIGVDTISIDSVDSHNLPNHNTMLGSNKIIIENLTNLQKLIGKRFLFSCLPLKILNGDGSPVRAIGIVE